MFKTTPLHISDNERRRRAIAHDAISVEWKTFHLVFYLRSYILEWNFLSACPTYSRLKTVELSFRSAARWRNCHKFGARIGRRTVQNLPFIQCSDFTFIAIYEVLAYMKGGPNLLRSTCTLRLCLAHYQTEAVQVDVDFLLGSVT